MKQEAARIQDSYGWFSTAPTAQPRPPARIAVAATRTRSGTPATCRVNTRSAYGYVCNSGLGGSAVTARITLIPAERFRS